MTPEELIEKMARELCRRSSGMEIMWKQWRDDATALHAVVCEAMREPSEEMLVAGNDAEPISEDYYLQPFFPMGRSRWRAMLSRSPLAEPKP